MKNWPIAEHTNVQSRVQCHSDILINAQDYNSGEGIQDCRGLWLMNNLCSYLRVQSRNMGFFQVRYNSRVVNYDRGGFIRLVTDQKIFNHWVVNFGAVVQELIQASKSSNPLTLSWYGLINKKRPPILNYFLKKNVLLAELTLTFD